MKATTRTSSKPTALDENEIAALDALGQLAYKPKSAKESIDNSNLLEDASGAGGPPPCVQFAAGSRVRVAACRVVLAVANGEKYRSALDANGVSHLEFELVRHKCHDFALIFEAARRVRDALTEADASTGLNRLVSEDGCEINAKAVLWALERLRPDRFGKPTESGSGGASGPKNVYNIIIPGVKVCGNLATTPQNPPIIDIKADE